jgi:hypothetical protein
MRYSLVTNNPWFTLLDHNGFGNTIILAGFYEIILRTKNNEERYKVSN